MKQYDKNVQIVMDFLKEEKYSPSVISFTGSVISISGIIYFWKACHILS